MTRVERMIEHEMTMGLSREQAEHMARETMMGQSAAFADAVDGLGRAIADDWRHGTLKRRLAFALVTALAVIGVERLIW